MLLLKSKAPQLDTFIMNHESVSFVKKFYSIFFSRIYFALLRARVWSIAEVRVLFQRSLPGQRVFPVRLERAGASETVDFSLFTPIRRPYYLRAVDTSRCHRFPKIQRTDYKSRACKCAFYRADSSKCSSRRRRLRDGKSASGIGATRRKGSSSAAFGALRRKSGVSSIK